jgi:signal recognition particle subunit SRP68
LYKSLKFSHAPNKKGAYEGRELTAEEITEGRHFMLPLMNAERAWAHAMEIKKEMENTKKWQSHRRHHLVKRLKRATQWADTFKQLCAAKGVARTALEAEAYATHMKGNFTLEVEKNWKEALQLFMHARSLYEQLGRTAADGDKSGNKIFMELVSEVEPVVLFCKYQQQKAEGNTKASDLEQLKGKGLQAPAYLVSSVESLVSETEQSVKLESIAWRGKTVSIPTTRLVAPTSDALALVKKMAGEEKDASLETRMEAYGSLFQMFNTIKQVIQSEKNELAGGGASAMSDASKEQKGKLEGFEKAVSGLMLESQLKRNVELIEARWARYVAANKQGRKAANTSPEEMHRLYEHLKMDVFDLSELAEDEDEALYESCSTAMNAIKTILCFFLGEQYYLMQKSKEAYLLYNRAVDYSDMLEGSNSADSLFASVILGGEKAAGMARIGRCVSHAKACATTAEEDDSSNTTLNDEAATDAAMSLLDHLDVPQSFAAAREGRHVYQIPPPMQSLLCQPFMLDTAVSHITYPEVPADKTGGQAKGSSILGMFGWGAKK